jgi:hypothetical protein
VTRDEWLASFCAAAGVERPTADEIRSLLDLAGSAAHASERTAAPIACWIAARSSLALDELLLRAAEIAPPSDAR